MDNDLIFIEFQGPVAYILFALAFLILFERPLEYGMSYGFLRSAQGESLQVKDIFHVFKNYSNAVFSNRSLSNMVRIASQKTLAMTGNNYFPNSAMGYKQVILIIL